MQIDPQRLVEARLARAMSQEEAAIATDLSARTIQRIEAGQPAALESTKALLTIFGAEIISEPPAPTADTVDRTTRDLTSKMRQQVLRTASLAVVGVRLLAIAMLLVVAGGKLILPSQTGLFVGSPSGEQSFALGIINARPPGATEVLGFWLVPIMILAAGLLALSFGRARYLVMRLGVSG